MAKQITYLDAKGNSYSESYWRLTYFEVDLCYKYGVFHFSGYANKAARDNGLESIDKYEYSISGSDFQAAYNAVLAEQLTIQTAAYNLAVSVPKSIRALDGDGNLTTIQQPLFLNGSDV